MFPFSVAKRGGWRNSCVLLLALAGPALAGPESWQLRENGIGPLAIGMRFNEVNKRLGKALKHTEPALRASPHCEQLALAERRRSALLFINDRLTRIDLWDAGARTNGGVAIGDPASRVVALYPTATRAAGEYDEAETVFTAVSRDGRLALRFDTRDGKVNVLYAGTREAIALSEGCL